MGVVHFKSTFLNSCLKMKHDYTLTDPIIFTLYCADNVNHLNAELNPICYLLALLGTHHFLHVSRIRVK